MRKRISNGFTLIEMIIALGIFAVVSVSIYTTFVNGVKLNRQINLWSGFYHDTLWTMNSLTMDLENMKPYHYHEDISAVEGTKLGIRSAKNVAVTNVETEAAKPAAQQQINIFKGDSHGLTIFAVKDGQPIVVRYYLKPLPVSQQSPAQTYELIRAEISFKQFFDSKNDQSEGEEVLMSPLPEDGLLFSYGAVGKLSEGNGEITWSKFWHKDYAPAGVRVELTYVDPELSVNPIKMQKDIFLPVGMWSSGQGSIKAQ